MAAPETLPSAYIAFQGGGALGMAHLGAWREVAQHFEIIGTAGTSAGSIAAAFCAAGYTPAHAITTFSELNWSDYVNRQSLFKLFLDRDAYSDGKHFHQWLRSKLSAYVPGRPYDINFAELFQFQQVYLAVVACDLNDQLGKPLVFDKDTEPQTTVSSAVRASISIPALFTPVSDSNRRRKLVDGGVLLNFPVELLYAKAKAASCPLIGVRFQKPVQYLEQPKIWKIVKSTIDVMMRSGNLPPERIVQDPNYIDIVIDVSGFDSLSFDLPQTQKETLLQRGADAAKLALAEYKARATHQPVSSTPNTSDDPPTSQTSSHAEHLSISSESERNQRMVEIHMPDASSINPIKLRNVILGIYDTKEKLKILCRDLEFPYARLQGDTLELRISDLIEQMTAKGQYSKFVETVLNEYPGLRERL